jgi:hypothetical protein
MENELQIPTRPLPVIKLVTRQDGYAAEFEGDPESAVTAPGRAEVIGKLVQLHGGQYGLKVASELGQPEITPSARALIEFNSQQCPCCPQPKQSGFWFCQRCWDVVKKYQDLRTWLWKHEFRHDVLPVYWRAKEILKKQ